MGGSFLCPNFCIMLIIGAGYCLPLLSLDSHSPFYPSELFRMFLPICLPHHSGARQVSSGCSPLHLFTQCASITEGSGHWKNSTTNEANWLEEVTLVGLCLNCIKIFTVNCVFFQCSSLQSWSLQSPINDTGSTMQEMSVPAAQQHQLMCSDPFSGVRKQVVCSIHSVPGLPGCWTRLYLHKEFSADMRILLYSPGKRLLMQSQATSTEL